MIPLCSFADVSEHDMDLLIMEEFVCDEGFRKIFLEKLNIKDCIVDKAYHSLADSNGESDITFVVDINGSKVGILIEDKIDAITMPKQSERYYVRGKKVSSIGNTRSSMCFWYVRKNIGKNTKMTRMLNMNI